MATPDALWRAAFLDSPLPLVALDWRGVLATWNAAFATLFRGLAGLEADRFEGSFHELVRERGGVRLDYFAAELILGARDKVTVETPFTDASGSRRWLSARLSVIEPGTSGVANANRFILCFLDDISDRVIREDGLVAAKEEAEKATRTKSLFLANMSHEIRTPIQTILGVVELLGETALDGEQSDYAAQIGFSADVLLALINDILDFSKIEAGKLNLEAADFNLHALLGQSVDLLALDAHRKGLELVMDIGDRVPVFLRGDSTRLRQILINLLKNAIKFTQRGLVGLHVTRTDDGDRLRFEVRDTGIGIPEELRQRLFTPFYQADLSASRRAGGTGLGLAISRHLVELMEGGIGVLPNEPSGSIFWFEIPVVVPEASEEPPAPLLNLENRRLLVVDDNDEARLIAMRIAAHGGWETSGAVSGSEALRILRTAATNGVHFDACLIDQSMPTMDGWRLGSEIHGDPALADIKLILMVPAGTIGRDAKMKLLRWFAAYVPKPVKADPLLDALEAAFGSGAGDEVDEAETLETLPEDEAQRLFNADVLIAEDHEVNRQLFTVLLGRLGLRVDEAHDGEEAVEKALRRLREGRPHDLVLLDIFMPRRDGYEAARELRLAGWKGPIIAVTASALKGEREKCVEAGMDDILLKPFRKADLEGILTAWLPSPHKGTTADGTGRHEAVSKPGEGRDEAPRKDDEPSRRTTKSTSPELRAENPQDGQLPMKQRADSERFILDWDRALETFLGQESTVRALMVRFESKVGAQLGELAEALERRDFATYREIAHSIKGAAWNLSATALGDAAREAETAGRQGDDLGATAALAALREAFAGYSRALRALGVEAAP